MESWGGGIAWSEKAEREVVSLRNSQPEFPFGWQWSSMCRSGLKTYCSQMLQEADHLNQSQLSTETPGACKQLFYYMYVFLNREQQITSKTWYTLRKPIKRVGSMKAIVFLYVELKLCPSNKQTNKQKAKINKIQIEKNTKNQWKKYLVLWESQQNRQTLSHNN